MSHTRNGPSRLNPDPPLLIIAPLADDFDLVQLPWCDAANGRLFVNRAKFENLDLIEVIVDAMPFLLSRLTAAETEQRFAAAHEGRLFSDLPPPLDSAIGVVPSDNLTRARHLPEINRRLLLLGKWIGESLNATAVTWMPSRRAVSFADFDKIVDEYLADGPFPTMFQTSCSETRDNSFVTNGLRYFTGQEIRRTVSQENSHSDISRNLMRIIDTIMSKGKMVSPARSNGMNEGETLIFTPSDDLEYVDIIIENNGIAPGPITP